MSSIERQDSPPRTHLGRTYGESRRIPQVDAYLTDLTQPGKGETTGHATDEDQEGILYEDQFEQEQDQPRSDAQDEQASSSHTGSSANEAEEDHHGALSSKQSERKRKKDLHRGSSRVVTDPITYRKVRITNTDVDIDEAYDRRRSRGGRVMDKAFPPVEWDRAIDGFKRRILKYALLGIIPALSLPAVLGFWVGTIGTILWCSSLAFHFNRASTSEWLDHKWDLERRRGISSTNRQRDSQSPSSSSQSHSHSHRDKKSSKGRRVLEDVGGDEAGFQEKRESVEWMNSVLRGLWPIIDPKLFVSVVDLLEDVMQASIPSFIETVRISDLSQGNHPIRIISMRTLPESAMEDDRADRALGEDGLPKDESDEDRGKRRDAGGEERDDNGADPFVRGKKIEKKRKRKGWGMDKQPRDPSDPFVRGKEPAPGQGKPPPRESWPQKDKKSDTDQDSDSDSDSGTTQGKYVNLEIAFAYRALPVQGKKVYSKAKNAHMIIDFGLGLKGVFSGGLPIWVELRGVVGTLRLRVELTAEPPFIKHTTISFLGLPKVEISAIPMIDLGIRLNAMNLPLVSTFISNSINTAIYEYVAPKSLTVDLGQMLVGDDIKKDTDALGIVVVTIHRANVEAADFGGKSDPYVTVSYAKYGKPLFSTRIILGEREPVWKATAFCLVRPDAFQVRERLALQIWDSDRFTADDELGRVEIDLYDLYRHRGKMKYHKSGLKHIDRNKKDVDGELHFSIGYFPKVMPHEKSTKEAPKDKDMPSDFQDKEEMQANRPKTMDDQEDQIIAMSPSDEYPSGILSIQVHEAFDLERQVIAPSRGQKSKSTPFSHPSSADDATREEGDDLPSAYFRIRINDETTYQSRVKPIQSHPFFQAGQERFIRDWRTAVINIQVRDSRVRESDPLLGTVQLRLQDAFRSRSQLTKTYPIVGGIGYGRLRVSLLFRPVEMKIPRSLLGWETATIIVKQNIRVEVSDEDTRNKLSHCRFSLRTAYGSKSLRHHPEKGDEGNAMTWTHRRSSLPVRKRFSSPLIITFKGNAIGLGSNIVAMGVLWLMCVEDNVRHQISLPIYTTKDWSRLEQNFWTPYHSPHRDPSSQVDSEHFANDPSHLPSPESYGLKQVGTAHFDLLILPGLSSAHRKPMRQDPRGKIIIEGFDTAVRAGLREDPESEGQIEEEDEKYPLSEDEDSDASQEGEGPAVAQSPLMDKSNGTGLRWDDEDVVEHGRESKANGRDEHQLERDDSHTDSTSTTSKGLKHKFKEWKENQHDLHTRHRGLAQSKAFRSAKWMKDTAVTGAVKVKHKFEMHERNPDIESEV